MRAAFVCLALAVVACGAPRQEQTAINAAVEISNAWAAPTPGGVTISAGYVTVTNRSDEIERLVGASSARAGGVELHEMAMDGAVMRMRPADALSIAPGGALELAPGGAHLMFFDVTSPFVEGEQIPVTLRFERAGDIDVMLPVRRSATHGAH